jgi:TctA family transporter
MILEPIIERSIQQSLMMADGNFLIFVRRPISALLLSAVALLILKALLRRRRNQGGVPFAGGPS